MKVLMINSVCGYGSTGRICTDIAELLISQGNDCRIAYGRGTTPEKFREISYKICTEKKVIVNGVKSRLLDNEGFNACSETKKLVEWIDSYNPDVIHLHNLHGYYINVEILFDYLKKSSARVIWTLHDCWSFTGHCAHYITENCDKWKSHCYDCPKSHGYPSSAFLDKSSKNYYKKKEIFTSIGNLTIVTPSKWLAEQVNNSFFKKFKVEVINNGIDLSVFKPMKSGFKEKYSIEDKKIILGVSSVWNKNKGLGDFIKLSEILNDEQVIVLVGLNKEQLNNLPKSIIGIERTNNIYELAEIYSSADIFFNPTYQDTYPTVNLEAQACGTPVISYDTAGSVESIPHENVIAIGDYKIVPSMLDKGLKAKADIVSKSEMLDMYLSLYGG